MTQITRYWSNSSRIDY